MPPKSSTCRCGLGPTQLAQGEEGTWGWGQRCRGARRTRRCWQRDSPRHTDSLRQQGERRHNAPLKKRSGHQGAAAGASLTDTAPVKQHEGGRGIATTPSYTPAPVVGPRLRAQEQLLPREQTAAADAASFLKAARHCPGLRGCRKQSPHSLQFQLQRSSWLQTLSLLDLHRGCQSQSPARVSSRPPHRPGQAGAGPQLCRHLCLGNVPDSGTPAKAAFQ